MSHLSEEQLIEFRNGASDDPRLREHVATCFECRRALDDRRWELSLRHLKGDPGKHPPREELLAFWDHALSSERAEAVLRHLRRCSRCLALYGRLRSSDPHEAYASPPPAVVSELKRRLRGSRRLPLLGSLLLDWRPGGGRLRFEPALEPGAPSSGPIDLQAFDGHPAAAIAREGGQHPASAGARMLRYRRRAVGDDPPPAPEPSGIEARQNPPDLCSNAISVEADGLILDLQASWRRDCAYLAVEAHRALTGEPVEQLVLRVEVENARVAENRTDAEGRAVVAFPPGESALSVRLADAALRLTLRGRF